MSALTREKLVAEIAMYQSEHGGAFPPVRAMMERLGGNYNRLAAMMNTLRPADDVDDIPIIPEPVVQIAATLLRWDSLAARTRALVEERLPALEGQHSELLATVNSLRERHMALAKDVAVLEGKRGALLLELSALQSEMRNVLMGVRPESAFEVTYDQQPKL